MDYATITDPQHLFEAVWHEEFLPVIREKRRTRQEHQTEAFLDTPLTVCGEEVRQMTPDDLLTLDALGNPFVCGGHTSFTDAQAVLWELSPLNDHTASWSNLWRRARQRHRLEEIPITELHDGIVQYVARMFASSVEDFYKPTDSDSEAALAPELKTHFLAPLLGGLCAKIGHIDPKSGNLLGDTPLPRLLQYQATHAEAEGEKQYNETDSLRNRCLERTAQILHGRSPAQPDEPAVGSAKAG